MDPQSPDPRKPRFPYLGDGIEGVAYASRVPDLGGGFEGVASASSVSAQAPPSPVDDAHDVLSRPFPGVLPAATGVFGNIFEITNCVCALQNPLLVNIHTPLEAASISSHIVAMLSISPPDLVRCVATVEGFGERGCMNRAEWWTVAVALCYQIFSRQEGFYKAGLKHLQIYQKVKTDYDLAVQGNMWDQGAPGRDDDWEEDAEASNKFDDFLKRTIFYHVHKFLVGFCYGHGGYIFATRYSVVSLLYNDKVVECVWKGKLPQDFYVTLALENINALPVSTFRTRDESCMWQCIYTYVCVLDILGMQDAEPRCCQGAGWYRHDSLARALGIKDWLDGPDSRELVTDLIPSRNLKRPLPGDA